MIFRVKFFIVAMAAIALPALYQKAFAGSEMIQQQLPPMYEQSIQQRLDTKLFDQYTDEEMKWKELLKKDPNNEYYKYKVEQIEKRKQAIEDKYFYQ